MSKVNMAHFTPRYYVAENGKIIGVFSSSQLAIVFKCAWIMYMSHKQADLCTMSADKHRMLSYEAEIYAEELGNMNNACSIVPANEIFSNDIIKDYNFKPEYYVTERNEALCAFQSSQIAVICRNAIAIYAGYHYAETVQRLSYDEVYKMSGSQIEEYTSKLACTNGICHVISAAEALSE